MTQRENTTVPLNQVKTSSSGEWLDTGVDNPLSDWGDSFDGIILNQIMNVSDEGEDVIAAIDLIFHYDSGDSEMISLTQEQMDWLLKRG